MNQKKICIIGLGYIGLPTASLLATKGYQVHGVDVQQDVVDNLNKGEIHIVEPDLDVLVRSAVNSGQFKASLEPCEADIYIIAVPTPFDDQHNPDLSYVEQASTTIAPFLKEEDLVILESTSPVGTTELVRDTINAQRSDLKSVHYAHCPERVIPGRVLHELIANDRVVGGLDDAATEAAVAFYETFVAGEVIATNARTAELCKLAENSFRDVNIAYANELSLICDKLNISVWELIHLANHHPRVNILQPGPGVGGHCIAVDPWFIVSSCPEQAKLIRASREVNEFKPKWVMNKVKKAAEKLKNPVIACLGASFKPDIDDLRESPALDIAKQLTKDNIGEVLVCEPNVNELKDLNLVSLDQALSKADIIVVLVDHKQFKKLSREQFNEKIVIDTRGIL